MRIGRWLTPPPALPAMGGGSCAAGALIPSAANTSRIYDTGAKNPCNSPPWRHYGTLRRVNLFFGGHGADTA